MFDAINIIPSKFTAFPIRAKSVGIMMGSLMLCMSLTGPISAALGEQPLSMISNRAQAALQIILGEKYTVHQVVMP